MEPSSSASQILIIEDDADDSFLLTRQLAKAQLDDHATVISDAREALAFLEAATSLPMVIFLDLRLPGFSGIDFLLALRQNTRLEPLPVIVMTSSMNPRDFAECERLGVIDYLTKPISLSAFIKAVAHLFPQAKVEI